MKNFKAIYNGLLYACIFLNTLVVIFTPFWIVGELLRTWLKSTSFNWWCIAVEIGAFISLIIAMSMAGVKTAKEIEAINPMAQNDKGGGKAMVMLGIIMLLFTGCADEPAGTIKLVSHPGQDSIRVYAYWTTDHEKIYIARFVDRDQTTTTWFEWQRRGKQSVKVPHYSFESAP